MEKMLESSKLGNEEENLGEIAELQELSADGSAERDEGISALKGQRVEKAVKGVSELAEPREHGTAIRAGDIPGTGMLGRKMRLFRQQGRF